MRKITSLLCAIVLSVSFAVGNAASAAVILPDSPAYSYTHECSSDLSISGTTATCNSSVTGYYNKTTKIVIIQILQKQNSSGNWDNVCSWSDTVYSFQGSLTNTKTSLSGGTYRLKTVAIVYAGTANETITKYSE